MFDSWTNSYLLIIGLIAILFFSARLCYRAGIGTYLVIKPAMVNNIGLVQLTEKALKRSLFGNWKNSTHEKFPVALAQRIRRHTPGEISRISLKIASATNSAQFTTDYKDLQRCLTIASAVHRFELPASIVVWDKRSAELYAIYLKEMECRIPSLSEKDPCETARFMSEQPDTLRQITIANYTPRMQLIGTMLMNFSKLGQLPLFCVFYATFQLNIKKDTGYYKEHEVRAMVTAYAMVMGMALPRCYVLVNALSVELIFRLCPPFEETALKTRHLRVVT